MYQYRKSNSVLNALIIVGFLALVILFALVVFGSHKEEVSSWVGLGEGGSVIDAQIVGVNPAPAPPGLVAGTGGGRFPAISQRDKSQYADEAEWRTWAASSCSAAALSSVLNGYGKSVRVTDVLAYLQEQNAIKPNMGLYRYDVFASISAKYGLKAAYSEDKDLEAHFNRILDYLKRGVPVIINVYDPAYFPGGHFIVATGLNPDGTAAIINPDPARDKTVSQNWPLDGLKRYFASRLRSAAITTA